MAADGRESRRLSSTLERVCGFSSDSRRLVTDADEGTPPTKLNVWALPEGRLERTLGHAEASSAVLVGDRLLTLAYNQQTPGGKRSRTVRELPLDGTAERTLGMWETTGLTNWEVDPTASSVLALQGGRLVQQSMDALSGPGRLVGTHEGNAWVCMRPWRDRAVTGDSTGELRIWDVAGARPERTLKSPTDVRNVALDPNGRFLAAGIGDDSPEVTSCLAFVFDLGAPLAVEPAPLLVDMSDLLQLQFSPDGSWLATVHNGNVVLWNMAGARSAVLVREKRRPEIVGFTPNGDLLSASQGSLVLQRWSPSPAAADGTRELLSGPGSGLALYGVDPQGRFVVVVAYDEGELFVVPLDGSPASRHRISGPEGNRFRVFGGSLHPAGRFFALHMFAWGRPEASAVSIVDLETGEQRTLDTHPEESERCVEPGSELSGFAAPLWLPDGRLVSDGDGGLRVWDLETGASRQLRACREIQPSAALKLLATPDSRTVLRLDGSVQVAETSSLSAFDLVTGETREITSHGNRLCGIALDPTGSVLVTGDRDGTVRVGLLTGEEPHLLFGHSDAVWAITVSPDGRWIVSSGADGTIRLWPMPDLSKPPLHTLPQAELLAKLRSLTNLRAVPDPGSDSGFKVEIGPFPGWAEVPEWWP